MPSRSVHNRVNEALLGEDFDWLNRLLDAPSRYLGARHRVLLHSDSDALMLALMSKDPVRVFVAARLHQMVDKEARNWPRLLIQMRR